MNFRTSVIIGSLLFGLTLLSGCGGGGGSSQLPDPTVKYVNAVSDSSSLDFYVDDALQLAALAAGTATPGFRIYTYRSDADGGYDFSVNLAGSTTDLARDYRVFQRNTHTIDVVYGLTDPAADQDKAIQQAVFTLDRKAPNGNKSRLVIFNALNQAAGVENQPINFQSYDPTNPASDSNPQFHRSNLGYGGFDSTANVLDIDAGSFTFQARQSGVDGTEVYASSTQNFVAGRTYLVLVRGQVGSATQAPVINYVDIESL